MVHKPERWAVNAAGVAPSWQWAWRGLQSYVPLWEPGEPVNGFFDVVRQRTCSSTNPGVYGSEPTSIGMGVSVNDNTALGYSMGDHAEWSARLAGKKFATFMWVGAYNEDLNGLRGMSKGTTAQSTTDWNLGTGAANQARFQLDGAQNITATDVVSATNPFVYFGLFSEGTIYVRVGYVGGQILNPSQGGNSTGSSTIQMNRATGVDATLFSYNTTTSDLNRHWNGTANAAAIWDRLLTLEEMNMLVADPFGPIRPRRLTPADVTPGSDPFRTKVFVP